MGVSKNSGTPKTLLKWDDLGVFPLFLVQHPNIGDSPGFGLLGFII